MTTPGSFLNRLRRDKAGLAVTEAALIMPFFLAAGLWGIELAHYSLTTMRVGQLAVQVADNASRIGDTSTLENRKIYEADIDDLLRGAALQGGKGMPLYERGRVIVSSLEVNDNGQQYIHWQRCAGKQNIASSYGVAGDVLPNGIGPSGREVSAMPGEAVIFVQLSYQYQPLISADLVSDSNINSVSSFMVRSSRDLSQIYQINPSKPDPVRSCNTFDNPY